MIKYLKFPNGKVWPVENNWVTAQIEVDMSDLHVDLEGFLDIIADYSVGAAVLESSAYAIIGGHGTTLLLEVTGNIRPLIEVYGIVGDGNDPDEGDQDERMSDATFEDFALQQGWLDCEIEHASAAGQLDYGDETVIRLGNGRELRCPASTEECTYARITVMGYELAYWTDDEWQEAPSEVMGALLGAACHGGQ